MSCCNRCVFRCSDHPTLGCPLWCSVLPTAPPAPPEGTLGVLTRQSSFWRGRQWRVREPTRGFQLWLHSITRIYIARCCIADYNSVNTSGFAILCTPSWMSQTQLGSAPENLKELYQTIPAYFKAANTTEVFLLALQLVWALFKILTSVCACKVWLGFAQHHKHRHSSQESLCLGSINTVFETRLKLPAQAVCEGSR